MMSGDATWRVPIVVRPFDVALALVKTALVPLLLFVAAVPTLKQFTGAGSVIKVAGGLSLAVLYVLVLQTPVVAARVDRVMALVRRRVALSCDHDERASHREGLACHLTAEALRVPVFHYEAQRLAVDALAEACDGGSHGQFWFVEGTSGSGKTRTALLLVQTLIRDLRRFELGSRCFLYDFADDGTVQDQLLRRLGSPRHDGAVVLVDNFQLVRADVLRVVTDRLVDRPGRAHERLLVFLARPGDAWNLSPGADVRILSQAKNAHRHVSLVGPSAEEVVRRVRALDAVAATQLRSIGDGPVATAAQLHLAQVIVRNAGVTNDVRDLLSLFAGTSDDAHSTLLRALGTVVALTMHRGAFRPAELRGSDATARRRDVRRLHRARLLTKLNLGGSRFVFHEAIAELCIDRLTGRAAFDDAFGRCAAGRLTSLLDQGDALGGWLTAVELGAQETVTDQFNAAMSRGAYSRMARCLQRASRRYVLNEPLQLQLAILLDRTGDFAGSRAVIGHARQPSKDGRLTAMLIAERIEAGHDERALADAAALHNSDDPTTALIGEYWQLHMAGHRGQFTPQRLLELASDLAATDPDGEDYWAVYAMARMHFDSLRHHYLAGGLPIDAVASPRRQDIDDFLSRCLPTFAALHALYGKAHLVGHVLLARLALFAETPAPEHLALAGIEPREADTVQALAAAAERLYSSARDEFWQYGDREASYLQADVMNMRMIQADAAGLDVLQRELHAYEAFIEDTGFADLRSYPHLYNARWHVLRHFAQLLSPEQSTLGPANDRELEQAARSLDRAVAHDMASGNAYGLHRAEVLRFLLGALQGPFDTEASRALAARMRSRGYGFEAELCAYLADLGPVPISVLVSAFRFYPIVHQ